ncbi:MAG: hypothetical protein ACTTHG_00940 [Treponemataceae bacterium]
MNKYSNLVYIAAATTFLIPATGRFAVGLILCIGIIFLTILGTLMNELIKKFLFADSASIYMFIMQILLCMFFKQLIILFSPVMGIYINYTIYLTAFSSMMISYLNDSEHSKLSLILKKNIVNCLKFCSFSLFFFFLRDYIGYKTFSLPGRSALIEFALPALNIDNQTFFGGSIPFAVLMLSIFLSIYTFATKKFNNRKKEAEK